MNAASTNGSAPPTDDPTAEDHLGYWHGADRDGRHGDALVEIDRAIALASEVGDYHCCRARTLSFLDRWPEALSAAEAAIALGHRGRDAHLLRGHGFFAAGRFDDAVTAYADALAVSPGDPTASLYRAKSLWTLDRIEEAETAFDDAEAAEPAGYLPFFERGRRLFDAGEYERAADCLDQAVDRQPRDKQLRQWRGAAYCQLGLYDLAVDELDDGLALGPATPLELRWRGEARARLGEHAAALADFEASLFLEPEIAYAHDWRGWLLMELGRLEEAAAAYEEALRLAPTKAYYYEQRSKIRDRLGRHDQAAADFETCLDLELKDNPPPAMPAATDVYPLVQEHFAGVPLEQLTLTERYFPARVSPDLQRALDALPGTTIAVDHALFPKQNNVPVHNFQALYTRDRRNPVTASAPHQYEADIGEDKPVRCLWTGTWLLTHEGTRFAALTTSDGTHRRFQVAAPATPAGEASTTAFLGLLEGAVARGSCFRGKVLSLEDGDEYDGRVGGLKVHRLRRVAREDVVLPAETLDLLDRNVLQFAQARPRLRDLGLSTRKGLLFHGPPGTGKTHTVHYLTAAMPGTTTLLITAEQVGRLGEYMTLARLFQPSLVVIEDVDLIARERRSLRSGVEETLLNRLLNEMDGLTPDADILFVLTTNAPAALEEALAGRPGRVDQAIEFPYPDAAGRSKLVRMYAGRAAVEADVIERIAARKEPLSPAFIKELMRRAAQAAVLRGTEELTASDVDRAIDEMFHAGGLHGKLFGFAGRPV